MIVCHVGTMSEHHSAVQMTLCRINVLCYSCISRSGLEMTKAHATFLLRRVPGHLLP